MRRSKSGNHGIVRRQWCMANQRGETVLDLVATSLWHCTDAAQNVLPCLYVAKDGAELARAKSALDDLFRK